MNKFSLTDFRNIALLSETEITSKWRGESLSPKVSFVCTAYNHEEFIEDTIRGFLLQETDFPFEILIHDDASTDKTATIISHYAQLYPQIIRVTIQTENQFSRDKNYPFDCMIEKARGKYIATCEGDDFWFCKNKISEQVNIFERNSRVTLVYSQAYIYLVTENKVCSGLVGKAMTKDAIYSRNRIPTLTVMFEKEALIGFSDYVGCNQKKWIQSDYQLWLWLNIQGEVFFYDKITSVYRVLTSSASRPKNIQAQYNFRKSVLSTSTYFAKRNCNASTLKQIMLKNHFFLYMWCLKRNLPQAQLHKKKILELFSKGKAFGVRVILSFLIEKILVPSYYKLSRRK